MPETGSPNWTRFFDKDEIVTPLGHLMTETDLDLIRDKVPELVDAPTLKIKNAWVAFSNDYCAGFLVVKHTWITEFRKWLGF